MKGERIHEMVVGDILAQGSVIGAEHLLRGGRVDNALLHGAAGVKQQRRAWRDADIASSYWPTLSAKTAPAHHRKQPRPRFRLSLPRISNLEGSSQSPLASRKIPLR